VWHIGIGVASALEHLDNNGWVHCDVKSANVLLSCEWGVKLCDFGLASRAFPSQTFLSRAPSLSPQTSPIAGSPGWMAPEVLNGHTPDPKADIFSLGVVIWEMVTGGQFPWHDKSSSQIRELVSRLKLRLHIPRASRELYPKELLEVLDSCWTHDGRDRPHAQVVAQRLQERRGGTESQSERERILQILRIPAPISPEDLYTASIDRLCL